MKGAKDSLICQNLVDRTVDAKKMKTNDSKGTVSIILAILKGKKPWEIWVNKATENAWQFEKLSNAEGKQFHSSLSDTKAAFAELIKRPWKTNKNRYMEDHQYELSHNLVQYVTTLKILKVFFYRFVIKDNKSLDFRPFCRAKHYEKIEHPSLEFETEFFSPSMIHHSGGVTSHTWFAKKYLGFCNCLSKMTNNYNEGWTT